MLNEPLRMGLLKKNIFEHRLRNEIRDRIGVEMCETIYD